MRIQALWRYPVKSLLGESCQELDLDGRGVVGDRAFALADTAGKLGSGKTTTRFTRMDGLFSLRARSFENRVLISFPDGREFDIEDPAINHELSAYLERQVMAVAENEIPHFDDGAVHVLLSSELARLQRLVPDAHIDCRRFRANMVLDAPDHMRDDDLIGKVLTLGDAKLEVTHETERCRMVTMAQDELRFEPAILKTIVQETGMNFGVYARVIQRGRIHAGQLVDLSAQPRAHRISDSLR